MALVGAGGVAEIVLSIDGTLSKRSFAGAVLAADLGVAPGDSAPSLITVAKVGSGREWRSTGLASGVTRVFKTTKGKGSPVTGCYTQSTYTAASFLPSGVKSTLSLHTASKDLAVKLPVGVVRVQCGTPVNGESTVLSLVKNSKRKTLNVIAKIGAKQIFSSAVLDKKLAQAGMLLGVLPRAAGEAPTAMILAKRGNARELLVRDKGNKWQTIAMPGVPAGTTPTGFVGVRKGATSYVVVQLTDPAKATSYLAVAVPAGYL